MDILNRSALTDMAGSILRPLIAVLMRNKFTHSELTELVRQSYVEVAYSGFSLPNKRMTYSRAALLSGLSRKEVVRLYSKIEATKAEQSSSSQLLQNHTMQTVHGWIADCDYLDTNRKPKELATEGKENSFALLVNKYCGDIPYQSVLKELNHLGVTSETSQGTVKLLRADYAPQRDELEKIRVMSVCVSDLFGTAIQNTGTAIGDVRFQRQLVYSGIEEKIAQRFHEAGSEKAMALFDILNEFLTARTEPSSSLVHKSAKRVGLGIYYFEDACKVKSVKLTSEEHA